MGSMSDDEVDMGEIRRGSTIMSPRLDKGKGKGKERAWDEEMGQGYEAYEGGSSEDGRGAYPPVNEEEEAERKIQAVSDPCC